MVKGIDHLPIQKLPYKVEIGKSLIDYNKGQESAIGFGMDGAEDLVVKPSQLKHKPTSI